MTLTAPIPAFAAPTSLDGVRTGAHPVELRARIDPNVFRVTEEQARALWAQHLVAAQGRLTAALERNLRGAGVDPDEGIISWTLDRDPHGDVYLLGRWSTP